MSFAAVVAVFFWGAVLVLALLLRGRHGAARDNRLRRKLGRRDWARLVRRCSADEAALAQLAVETLGRLGVGAVVATVSFSESADAASWDLNAEGGGLWVYIALPARWRGHAKHVAGALATALIEVAAGRSSAP